MSKVALFLLYFFLAAGAGCEVGLYGGGMMGAGASLLVLLLCFQVHTSVSHRRMRQRYEQEIESLRLVGNELKVSLAATHGKIEDVAKSFEARSSAQSRKIVSELRALEVMMREQAGRLATAKARPIETATIPFEALNDSELLEAVRASLADNRVDLVMQPIVQLPQRKVRFYEAYSRLRAQDGRVIGPQQYIRVAAPAGLMSVVDNLFLFRCVQIVRRMGKKHRDVAVFCNISGDTLNDAEFFPQFLEYIEQNRDLAAHIVLEFSQDDVQKCSRDAQDNLRYLAQLGFAMSMDHVETLRCDFTHLRSLGFRYFKVKSEMLTGDIGAVGGAVTAEDFKILLARHEIDLIAEWVEDEKTVLQLLDFSVDYAEGFLFGEPRPVREEGGRSQPSQNATDGAFPARNPLVNRVIPLRKVV